MNTVPNTHPRALATAHIHVQPVNKGKNCQSIMEVFTQSWMKYSSFHIFGCSYFAIVKIFWGLKISSNTVMFRIRLDQLKFQRQCKGYFIVNQLSKQWRFCCCNAKGGVLHSQLHAINAYKPSNTWATAANVTVQTISCITALRMSNTRLLSN